MKAAGYSGPPIVLGLDISTSIVGVSILDVNGDLIERSHVDLRKVKGLWNKVDAVQQHFYDLKSKYSRSMLDPDPPVERIFVERNLSKFAPGRSSATVIMSLARFNGIVSWLARCSFGTDPEYVDFTKARKALGIEIQAEKKCGVPVKEQILKQVSQQVQWKCEYRTIRAGPRKGQRVIDEPQFDECDAWVVARSGLLHPDTIVDC